MNALLALLREVAGWPLRRRRGGGRLSRLSRNRTSRRFRKSVSFGGKSGPVSLRLLPSRGKMAIVVVGAPPSHGKMVHHSAGDTPSHGKIPIYVVCAPPSCGEVAHPLELDAYSLGKMVSDAAGDAPSRGEITFPPSERPYSRANPGIARGDVTAPCLLLTT